MPSSDIFRHQTHMWCIDGVSGIALMHIKSNQIARRWWWCKSLITQEAADV